MSLISRLREGERGRTSQVRAFAPQSQLIGNGTNYNVRGDSLIGVLVFSNIVFNLTDLATTFAAVGRGLAGVGPLVIMMSRTLGVDPLAALAMTTGILVAGALVIAVVGVRSMSNRTRKLALCYLLATTMVFYLISLNNIVWLVT